MDAVDIPRQNGELVALTYRLLRSGIGGVKGAKDCLKTLIEPLDNQGEKIYRWQYFRITDESGCTIEDATRNPPKTFREFVESPPLRGLGEKLADIERLLADDVEAVVRLRELTVAGKGNPTGNNQHSGNSNNVTISKELFIEPEPVKPQVERGNSRAYTLTRLKNERPDLFEKVATGDLSANRAAIEAGWRKQESPLVAAQRVWRKMTTDEQQQFLDWINHPSFAEEKKV